MSKIAINLIVAFTFLLGVGSADFAAAQATLEKPKQDSKQSAAQDSGEQGLDDDKAEGKQDSEGKAKPQDRGSDKKSDDKKSDKQKSEQEEDKKAEVKKPARRTMGGFGMFSSAKVSKKDPGFVKVFGPVASSMDSATVRITLEGKQISLGTVIDAAGLILTKASELRPGMECVVGGKKFTPSVLGIHPESDLALLRVEADSLNAIQWSDQPIPVMGRWVASPKAEAKDMPAIGIIATAGPREIPPSRPFIGIQMDENRKGILITEIVAKSPAKFAGLKVKDVIFEIEGVGVKTRTELIKEIGQFDVGDRIQLKVSRDGSDRIVKLTLAERDKIAEESQRSNQQNSMGSTLSRRRKDFPKAFQHDSMLNSNTCGGPIVDLSGKVIGINIARAGRVSSLALPIGTVLPIIEKLKTGELAPALVNKVKIEEIEAELVSIEKAIGKLPEKKNVLNVRYNSERARLSELEKFSKDYKSRVEEMEKLMTDYKTQLKELEERKLAVQKNAKGLKRDLDTVHGELRSSKKVKAKLKKDLENLKTGSSS